MIAPTLLETAMIQTIVAQFPQTQAIYLFGSHGTPSEWPESDVDIALLLPEFLAEKISYAEINELSVKLQKLLIKEVDLVNLRRVNTVFQIEVISAERRIFTKDRYAATEFEMLTMSYYQKLNEERREILEAFEKTGRAYNI